jgi:hypothetical protein
VVDSRSSFAVGGDKAPGPFRVWDCVTENPFKSHFRFRSQTYANLPHNPTILGDSKPRKNLLICKGSSPVTVEKAVANARPCFALTMAEGEGFEPPIHDAHR